MSAEGRVDVLGVPIDRVDFDAVQARVEAWLTTGAGPRQIATVNPEFVMLARRDPAFADVLRTTALNVADGVGIVWAARRFGRPVRERVGGADLMLRLCARAAVTGWGVYLLGAQDDIAARAGRALQARFPGLRIVGAQAGSPAEADAPALLEEIRRCRPELLFVAYGAPKQDVWLSRHLAGCQGGSAILGMGVGASFDYLTGAQRRAPAWVQRLGLEWLFRLLQQPWRLRRQLALPRYAALVMLESLRGRVRQQR